MTFIEKLKEAYIAGNWDGVGEVLEMLGSPVNLVQENTKQVEKTIQKVKKQIKKEPQVVQEEKLKQIEDFKVVHQQNQNSQSWEETPRVHKNAFVDDKQDLKNAPKYKPKGSKKTYANEEEYLREKVYPKTRSMPSRPAVTKVKMTCEKCNKTEELYPSTITYSDIETRSWKCNDCAAKG